MVYCPECESDLDIEEDEVERRRSCFPAPRWHRLRDRHRQSSEMKPVEEEEDDEEEEEESEDGDL